MNRALAEVGATAETRLRWLLTFAERSLAALTDDQWAVLSTQVRFLASQQLNGHAVDLAPWPPDDAGTDTTRQHLIDAQSAVKTCLTTLASGQRYECDVPAGRWLLWPPRRRRNGARRSAAIGRAFLVPAPAALVLTAADLLDRVGADLLRTCPYPGSTNEPPCGRVFLATHRNQDFCSKRHASRAAYLDWWRRQGSTRAKKGASPAAHLEHEAAPAKPKGRRAVKKKARRA